MSHEAVHGHEKGGLGEKVRGFYDSTTEQVWKGFDTWVYGSLRAFGDAVEGKRKSDKPMVGSLFNTFMRFWTFGAYGSEEGSKKTESKKTDDHGHGAPAHAH